MSGDVDEQFMATLRLLVVRGIVEKHGDKYRLSKGYQKDLKRAADEIGQYFGTEDEIWVSSIGLSLIRRLEPIDIDTLRLLTCTVGAIISKYRLMVEEDAGNNEVS